jgi:hypothetical protein
VPSLSTNAPRRSVPRQIEPAILGVGVGVGLSVTDGTAVGGEDDDDEPPQAATSDKTAATITPATSLRTISLTAER